MRRNAIANLIGRLALVVIQALPAEWQRVVREALWRRRVYLVVEPSERLVRGALAGYPRAVRELCAKAHITRYDARGGGWFDPATDEIYLAAGVETYERYAQVFTSSRHELFHYVCWNHPVYRADEDLGFPKLLRAFLESVPFMASHPRYRDWMLSEIRYGHTNVVEFFSNVPTNWRLMAPLPPPLAQHFAPLIDGAEPHPALLQAEERIDIPREGAGLREFQARIAGLDRHPLA